MPPSNERAFPIELTVTSMRVPVALSAGSVAVTMTAAALRVWIIDGSIVAPRRRSIAATLCSVKRDAPVSPVFARPTTRP